LAVHNRARTFYQCRVTCRRTARASPPPSAANGGMPHKRRSCACEISAQRAVGSARLRTTGGFASQHGLEFPVCTHEPAYMVVKRGCRTDGFRGCAASRARRPRRPGRERFAHPLARGSLRAGTSKESGCTNRDTADVSRAALAARGFEPRPGKELTCFSPVFSRWL